jgi:AmmeMemoRadiSam system protein B
MVRPPAVAGSFYPTDERELARQVDDFSMPVGAAGTAPPEEIPDNNQGKVRAIACVVPHAGFIYSGHVAGAVYSEIEIPTRCILIGPRHYPQGQPMSILTEGSWRTPLGEARIDAALAAEIAHACPLLREDPVSHEREHSLEVQLPFLQRLSRHLLFVPIVLASDRYPILEELGQALAQVIATTIAAQTGPVLMIASTDMNHYESDAVTRTKDFRALERILALDPRGLYDTVRNESITMCGYAATVVTLVAARELGAAKTRLVRYATSGDANGDRSRVVGYAGIAIR